LCPVPSPAWRCRRLGIAHRARILLAATVKNRGVNTATTLKVEELP